VIGTGWVGVELKHAAWGVHRSADEPVLERRFRSP
jgi:hypothetical protein